MCIRDSINTVHSLLDSFMARFKGVSTKHLGAYLDWFRWRRTFMAADSRSAESTVARQLANEMCIRDRQQGGRRGCEWAWMLRTSQLQLWYNDRPHPREHIAPRHRQWSKSLQKRCV